MLYTGAMEKGQMHGKGALVYPNNERYEGDFQHGKRHGYGVYTYADGGRFEGEWVDDKVHGRGVSVYASGNRYEGEWVDGKINGQVRAILNTHPLLLPRSPRHLRAGHAVVCGRRPLPRRVEGRQDARPRHVHLRRR